MMHRSSLSLVAAPLPLLLLLLLLLLGGSASASGAPSTLILFNPTCSATQVQADIGCACSFAATVGSAPADCSTFAAGRCGAGATSRSVLLSLTIIVRTCLVLKPGRLGNNMDPTLGNLTSVRRLVAKLALVITRGLVKPSEGPTYRRLVGDVRKERLARYNRLR